MVLIGACCSYTSTMWEPLQGYVKVNMEQRPAQDQRTVGTGHYLQTFLSPEDLEVSVALL